MSRSSDESDPPMELAKFAAATGKAIYSTSWAQEDGANIRSRGTENKDGTSRNKSKGWHIYEIVRINLLSGNIQIHATLPSLLEQDAEPVIARDSNIACPASTPKIPEKSRLPSDRDDEVLDHEGKEFDDDDRSEESDRDGENSEHDERNDKKRGNTSNTPSILSDIELAQFLIETQGNSLKDQSILEYRKFVRSQKPLRIIEKYYSIPSHFWSGNLASDFTNSRITVPAHFLRTNITHDKAYREEDEDGWITKYYIYKTRYDEMIENDPENSKHLYNIRDVLILVRNPRATIDLISSISTPAKVMTPDQDGKIDHDWPALSAEAWRLISVILASRLSAAGGSTEITTGAILDGLMKYGDRSGHELDRKPLYAFVQNILRQFNNRELLDDPVVNTTPHGRLKGPRSRK